MPKVSNGKTERRAINALECIIDKHATMDYQFNSMDKEMSWDGFIWLYKTDAVEQSKQNFEGRIPVQIKGHFDKNKEYVSKNVISYSVCLDDLKAYATEKGVLYFQIFITDSQTEIFYASLYPSKIAHYLDAAKKKGNKSSINIRFNKLQQNVSQMYVVVKQFHDEASQQGSVFNPLVQDRIKVDDFDKIKILNLAVVAENEYRALRRFSTGDVCLYGKLEGDKYFRPLDWVEESKFLIEKEVAQQISINGITYYDKYRCVADSDGGMIIRPSPNLELNFKSGKINIKCNSALDVVYNDAKFLKALIETGHYSVVGHDIDIPFNNISADFENQLSYIIDLYETLEMIGLKISIPLAEYTVEQQKQLFDLVNLRLGKNNSSIKDEYTKYPWKFGDKYYPLLIIKTGNTIELVSSVYTDKIGVFYPCDEAPDNKGYRMPLLAYHDIEVFSNLYCYDYDAFQEQIDSSDINATTADALLQCALRMITVYDLYKDGKALALADYLLTCLEPYEMAELITLNKLQIKKRLGSFDDADISFLENMQSDHPHILFGKNVLLGRYKDANSYFSQLPEHEQAAYKAYPIYKLFQECVSS